jgi:hypothetical protein
MPRRRIRIATAILALCMGAAHAQAPNPSANLGKQRAAQSRLEWEVKDAGHPILGNIHFAYLKTPIETPVGGNKVFTRMYVSCQKASRMLAIELTNGTAPDDQKGLKANKDPRLLCNRPASPGSDKIVQDAITSNWDPNELGDMMARNFRAFPLRECVSINVVQEVALPAGWTQKSAKVEFEIAPYNRQLDDVFAACGDVSAYEPAAAPKVASAPVKTVAAPPPPPVKSSPPPAPVKVAPAPPPPVKPVAATAPAPAADGSWLNARVLASGGRTNVRSTPSTAGHIVIQLDPGTPVLVQKTANDWWKAKPASGTARFEGYIRQDRLAFR